MVKELGKTKPKTDDVHTKKWSEMTDQEIGQHKRQQCSKCQYLSKKNGQLYLVAAPCDYLLITGHSRGCSPLDCVTHGVFKPKKRGKKIRRRLEW